jgi:anti-anti-sigma factor
VSNDHQPTGAGSGQDGRFSLTVRASGHRLDVILAGEVDNDDVVACLQSSLERVRQLGVTSVSIDLQDVSFLSASALGMLVAAHADLAQQGCSLEISRCSRMVRRLIGLADAVGMLPDGLWPHRHGGPSVADAAPAAASARATDA